MQRGERRGEEGVIGYKNHSPGGGGKPYVKKEKGKGPVGDGGRNVWGKVSC